MGTASVLTYHIDLDDFLIGSLGILNLFKNCKHDS